MDEDIVNFLLRRTEEYINKLARWKFKPKLASEVSSSSVVDRVGTPITGVRRITKVRVYDSDKKGYKSDFVIVQGTTRSNKISQ